MLVNRLREMRANYIATSSWWNALVKRLKKAAKNNEYLIIAHLGNSPKVEENRLKFLRNEGLAVEPFFRHVLLHDGTNRRIQDGWIIRWDETPPGYQPLEEPDPSRFLMG